MGNPAQDHAVLFQGSQVYTWPMSRYQSIGHLMSFAWGSVSILIWGVSVCAVFFWFMGFTYTISENAASRFISWLSGPGVYSRSRWRTRYPFSFNSLFTRTAS